MGNGKITKERITKSAPKRIRVPVIYWRPIKTVKEMRELSTVQLQSVVQEGSSIYLKELLGGDPLWLES